MTDAHHKFSGLQELYALMGPEALLAHIQSAMAALAATGVEITTTARIGLDEIAESVAEHHARHDPAALRRHIARAEAELAACAPFGRLPAGESEGASKGML